MQVMRCGVSLAVYKAWAERPCSISRPPPVAIHLPVSSIFFIFIANRCGNTDREEAAAARERLEAAEVHGARYVRSLEEQIATLRGRYEKLERHRATELAQLRKDVEDIQKATRECEKLAARCVAGDFAVPLTVLFSLEMLDGLLAKP